MYTTDSSSTKIDFIKIAEAGIEHPAFISSAKHSLMYWRLLIDKVDEDQEYLHETRHGNRGQFKKFANYYIHRVLEERCEK